MIYADLRVKNRESLSLGSYYDDTNTNLKYCYWDGSQWYIETVDDAGTVGHWTSITIDSDNNAHISYYDATNGDLKYAYNDETGIEGSEAGYSDLINGVYPNPSNGVFNIDFTLDYPSTVTIDIYDVSGRTVSSMSGSFESGNHAMQIDDLNSGLYICRVNVGSNSASRLMTVIR